MEQRVLGDYTIIKPIGQGALGTVYLAQHRFMQQQYALKILPEELSSDRSFIQRFEEDIAAIASLDHPHIVKMHNISFAQGTYFLVTNCVVDEKGETTNLAQYIAGLSTPLSEEEIFVLLKQVAHALDYAHDKKIGHKGLVHRCMKLNNILVGKYGSNIKLYLSDFGLARIIGVGAVLTRTYKNVAEALGIAHSLSWQTTRQDKYSNPPIDQQKLQPLHASFLQNYAFLAPEQKRFDDAQVVDAKADVYAFGILAYYLLTNEFPDGIFDPPSKRKQYRYQWDYLVRACLQSNPTKRPTHLLPLLEAIVPQSVSIADEGHAYAQEKKEFEIETAENKQPSGQVNSPLHNSESETTSVAAVATLKPLFQEPQLERPQTEPDPIFQVNAAVKAYHPERKDLSNIKPLMTDMFVIEGGNFYRGSQDGNRDEMPRHQITCASFAIDVHPVSNEQFVRFLEVMGGEKDSQHNDIIRLRDSRIKRSTGKLGIESGYAKHPVVGVTWYGAVAYAKWVGKRLPTEAEWEIAACGGSDKNLYPTGNDIEKTQANFFSTDTTAIMSYVPNAYGLYDMAGNVYEWCQDWYGYNYYEVSILEPNNPRGPLQGVYRVLRGGCWKSLKEDLRCSRRHRNNPGTVNGTYGFRCASDVH